MFDPMRKAASFKSVESQFRIPRIILDQ